MILTDMILILNVWPWVSPVMITLVLVVLITVLVNGLLQYIKYEIDHTLIECIKMLGDFSLPSILPQLSLILAHLFEQNYIVTIVHLSWLMLYLLRRYEQLQTIYHYEKNTLCFSYPLHNANTVHLM